MPGPFEHAFVDKTPVAPCRKLAKSASKYRAEAFLIETDCAEQHRVPQLRFSPALRKMGVDIGARSTVRSPRKVSHIELRHAMDDERQMRRAISHYPIVPVLACSTYLLCMVS